MQRLNDLHLQEEAIGIVKREKVSWQDATAFITERVSFQMRNLIKLLRKNYWGVFDSPIDPITGQKKIWSPLTESICEAVVKNSDLDTKDIDMIAKKPSAQRMTAIVRALARKQLENISFGDILDRAIRTLCVDGTVVWKTLKIYNPETGKKEIKIFDVDLLNVYIDPTAPSIQDAYRFTERALLTYDQVQAMDGWMNKDVVPSENLARVNGSVVFTQADTSKYVDVYELWGKIPEYLITGNPEDKDEIEGHIVCSGLDKPGKEKLHLIERNEEGKRPYEECWYSKVAGRWYGRGPAEKLIYLQLWANLILNMRVNRSRISQLGLFKIRKGAGITPQMLSRLPGNGAIQVTSMDDIEQLVVQEVGASSYKDEDVIYNWAQRQTSAFDASTGEPNTAQTATGAAIQVRSAMSGFVLVKKSIGLWLERWLKRQALPILFSQLSKNEILRLTGDVEEIRKFDETVADELVYRQLEKDTNEGKLIDLNTVEAEKQRILSELQKTGDARYIELKDKIDISDYDIQVVVSTEEIDKNVLAQNLMGLLGMAPEYKDKILQQVMDLMGLDSSYLGKPTQPVQPAQQPQQPLTTMPLMQGQQMQQNTTNANTL